MSILPENVAGVFACNFNATATGSCLAT